jgi:glycosyltransferase involved in cell wall biosynthesis
VFLAKPTAEKGIDLALEGFLVAASELGDRARTRLLVSAEGSRRTRRALEERIRGIRRRLPAGHELHYDPAPDLDAKQRLLTQAHALICPSRIPERRGMVCLEAMCSGVPVLVTRRGILPELVASTGGGQVLSENADPAEIGSCLSEWALSPRLLEERRLQAAAGVRRSFSPDRVCKAYLKVVDSVT